MCSGVGHIEPPLVEVGLGPNKEIPSSIFFKPKNREDEENYRVVLLKNLSFFYKLNLVL